MKFRVQRDHEKTGIESLEARRLLSASIVGGVLQVAGDNSANNIRISTAAGMTTVTIDVANQVFDENDYDSIEISAGAGDDVISLDTAILAPASIAGGDGNDSIHAGSGDGTLGGDAG